MSADLEHLAAAQAKADDLVRELGEPINGRPMLRIAITDPETNTRLATAFVSYAVDSRPHLRAVNP